MAFETAFESELNATLMLVERDGTKALILGVIASKSDKPGVEGEGSLCRAVSAGTTRRDAEIFIHALRREADRLEQKIGGISTRSE